MSDNINKTCQTCFSTGRKLFPITDLKILLANINLWEIHAIKGEICWECKAIVKKFYNFKQRATKIQSLLARANQNKINSASSLICNTKDTFDYEFNFDEDVKIEVIKVELAGTEIALKEETNLDFESIHCLINDDQPIHDREGGRDKKSKPKKKKQQINKKAMKQRILIETIQTDNDKLKKNGVKYKLIDEKEFKNKFKTIIFTEEELLLNREEKRNHPNFKKIPFKCDTCVLGFTRRDTFDAHMEKSHLESIGDFQCKICETRFANQHLVHAHTQDHYTSYRCAFCRYETGSQRAAMSHCRDKHMEDEAGKVHCSQCDSVLASPEELELHNMSAHTLHCDECGKHFKGNHTLRMHKSRIHNAHRQYICDVCHKTFNTKSRLECHMATHSAALARALAYCGTCKVQYKNIYVYRNHLKNSVNHSERAYKCSDCNKNFASRIYLQKHYDFYHLRKSPYKCNVCKKLFISEWRLMNHKQKHHGLARTRDHVCGICGKKFFTPSTLRAHQLTHSEHRSFMCEDCGDTFKQRPALYTHCKLVHKGIKRKK